jgi:hypothetical protein
MTGAIAVRSIQVNEKICTQFYNKENTERIREWRKDLATITLIALIVMFTVSLVISKYSWHVVPAGAKLK